MALANLSRLLLPALAAIDMPANPVPSKTIVAANGRSRDVQPITR
jgi:hypothetical protein